MWKGKRSYACEKRTKGVFGMQVLMKALEFLGVLKAGEIISGSRSGGLRAGLGVRFGAFLIKVVFVVGLAAVVSMGLLIRSHSGM